MSGLLSSCDILCMQETMLTKQDCPILNTVDDNFMGHGVAPVDCTDGFISGRPYGGVACLWKKSIDHAVTIVVCNYDWLICLKLCDGGKTHLPYYCAENIDKYNDSIGKLSAFIMELNTCLVRVSLLLEILMQI